MSTAYTINHKRLEKVTALDKGAHNKGAAMCAMEAVAYIAGEKWSDHPQCACPVISAFMRQWNDGLPDDERNALLLPLIPRLVGSRGSPELELRRSLMAADWLIRTHTPAWLRLAGLTDQAEAIAGLPEITSMAQYPSIRAPLEAVRKDGTAAWNAARDAAWNAAGAAARAAAWNAAGDAAGDAAGGAARAAAGAAAGDAAGAAAGDALKPTKSALQASAVALIERMLSATDSVRGN